MDCSIRKEFTQPIRATDNKYCEFTSLFNLNKEKDNENIVVIEVFNAEIF